MTVKTTTHLNFRGNAADALRFYQSVFDGNLVCLTYRQGHAVSDPAEAEQIMWGQVSAASGFTIMAYDVPARMAWHPGENALFVAVQCDDDDELRRYWHRLSEQAEIVHALAPARFAPLYGMLRDRFGIVWVLTRMAADEASAGHAD